MGRKLDDFKAERQRLNDLVLSTKNTHIKRFFTLDNAVYAKGAIPVKYKEMLGLVASMVLRCDDCIAYHVIQCRDMGTTDEEFDEVMSIGLIVGGSITIPHVRRAAQLWEELKN